MSRFITHSFVYIMLTGAMVWALCLFGGPYTDPFYLRFTTAQKKSMVIGTSRAAQGIVPSVMTPILKEKGWGEDLYNYSFTIMTSPFGEPYLESIKKKLDPTLDKNSSLFIITVDPWSISTLYTDTLKSKSVFLENKFAPANMDYVAVNPNPEYIFKNLDNRLLMIVRTVRHEQHPSVEDDGSLNVQVVLTEQQKERTAKERWNDYRSYVEKNRLSQHRLQYFEKTVSYLSDRGQCILVRIPVEAEMLAIENAFMPDFDSMINVTAQKHNIKYLNFADSSGRFNTNDGNHLTRKDAIDFSTILAKKIVED